MEALDRLAFRQTSNRHRLAIQPRFSDASKTGVTQRPNMTGGNLQLFEARGVGRARHLDQTLGAQILTPQPAIRRDPQVAPILQREVIRGAQSITWRDRLQPSPVEARHAVIATQPDEAAVIFDQRAHFAGRHPGHRVKAPTRLLRQRLQRNHRQQQAGQPRDDAGKRLF